MKSKDYSHSKVKTSTCMGPSIKYVTLFLANLTPLSHFVTHPGRPLKNVTHLGVAPPHFSRPSTKILYKFYLNCSRRFLYGEVLSGGPLSGRFCPGWFLSVPLSATIHLLQQKVKHHFKFHVSYDMYDKKFISVTSHVLDPLPLSQTVTLSRTPSPSSVTYFMDGP